MALSKILRAALGTSIGFAVAAWTIPSAAAQGNSTLGVRNVVLVHGGLGGRLKLVEGYPTTRTARSERRRRAAPDDFSGR
jgi:hypothetical protein